MLSEGQCIVLFGSFGCLFSVPKRVPEKEHLVFKNFCQKMNISGRKLIEMKENIIQSWIYWIIDELLTEIVLAGILIGRLSSKFKMSRTKWALEGCSFFSHAIYENLVLKPIQPSECDIHVVIYMSDCHLTVCQNNLRILNSMK